MGTDGIEVEKRRFGVLEGADVADGLVVTLVKEMSANAVVPNRSIYGETNESSPELRREQAAARVVNVDGSGQRDPEASVGTRDGDRCSNTNAELVSVGELHGLVVWIGADGHRQGLRRGLLNENEEEETGEGESKRHLSTLARTSHRDEPMCTSGCYLGWVTGTFFFLFAGLGALVGGLLLIAAWHVTLRLSRGETLGAPDEALAILVPHLFLGVALMVSLASAPSGIVIGVQSAGFFALVAMVIGAIRGSRARLIALFTRARLIAVVACIIALWSLAFVAMHLSADSIEVCLERARLMSPSVSMMVAALWFSLIVAWKGKVKGIESAPRHEGVWRSGDDGLALDVGEETYRVELAGAHRKEKDVRPGEPCVVFAPAVQGDGPFRGSAPLVASHIVAGTWQGYRRSLRDGFYCLSILAVSALWGLAFSAIELMLVAFV